MQSRCKSAQSGGQGGTEVGLMKWFLMCLYVNLTRFTCIMLPRPHGNILLTWKYWWPDTLPWVCPLNTAVNLTNRKFMSRWHQSLPSSQEQLLQGQGCHQQLTKEKSFCKWRHYHSECSSYRGDEKQRGCISFFRLHCNSHVSQVLCVLLKPVKLNISSLTAFKEKTMPLPNNIINFTKYWQVFPVLLFVYLLLVSVSYKIIVKLYRTSWWEMKSAHHDQ